MFLQNVCDQIQLLEATLVEAGVRADNKTRFSPTSEAISARELPAGHIVVQITMTLCAKEYLSGIPQHHPGLLIIFPDFTPEHLIRSVIMADHHGMDGIGDRVGIKNLQPNHPGG